MALRHDQMSIPPSVCYECDRSYGYSVALQSQVRFLATDQMSKSQPLPGQPAAGLPR